MTIKELENENQFLKDCNKELAETIAELRSEILLVRSEKDADLEPRFYFNRIIDDYSGMDEEDAVDKLVEINDYLDAYIGNHTAGNPRGNDGIIDDDF